MLNSHYHRREDKENILHNKNSRNEKSHLNRIFTIAIVVILVFASFFLAKMINNNRNKQKLLGRLQILSNSLDFKKAGIESALQGIARLDDVVNTATGKLPPDNKPLISSLKVIRGAIGANIIYLMNREGEVVACTPYGAEESRTLTGNNYSFRPYFSQVISSHQSKIYNAKGVTTGKRGIYVGLPIFNITDPDSIAGVIVAKTGLQKIDAALSSWSGPIALVDPMGVVFSSNQPNWLFKSFTQFSKEKINKLLESKQYGNESIKKNAIDFNNKFAEIGKTKYTVFHYPVLWKGWKLFAFESDPKLNLILFAEILVLFFLILVTGIYVFRWIRIQKILKSGRNKLLDQEERLELAMDAGKHGFWDWNLDTDEIYFSPRYSTMLGYQAGELPQNLTTWVKLMHPEDRKTIVPRVQNHVEKGESYEVEFRLKSKSGKWKWIKGRGKTFGNDQDGKTHRAIGTHEDITEQKQIENQLRAEEEKYRRIFEQFQDLYYRTDLSGKITELSPSVERLTGFSKDELIGKNVRAVYAKSNDRKRFFQELIKHGQVNNFDLVIFKKNGDKAFVSANSHLLYDQNKKPLAVEGVLRNITVRKQSEENLIKLNQAVEQSANTIVITDLDGNIEYVNPKFTETTGYTKKEALGENPRILKTEDQPDEFYKELWETITAGKEWRGQFHNKRKDGSFFWEQANIAPVYDTQGEMKHFIAVKEDITEQKEIEEELFQTNEYLQEATARANSLAARAEEANVAKSEFIANMSHEIRTPLNSIIGFSDLIMDTKLDSTQKEYIKNINVSGNSLLDVINDILDFSKIEAGRLEIESLEINLISLIEDMADIIKLQAHKKGLELILDIDPNLPQQVSSDPVRLKQVLTNLLSNAVKFTYEGDIEIRVKLKSPKGKKAEIYFGVKDSGIGISEQNQKKIFKSFTQADGSTTRNYGGTGLGLTISRQLVEKMGGELQLESKIGEGSCFFFILEMDVGETEEQPYPELEFHHALFVDGKAKNRTILKEMLKKMKIETILCSNAVDGVQKFKENMKHLDLIFLDYQLPEMNGMQLAKEITELGNDKPIILLSSSSDQKVNSENLIKCGIDWRLDKPVKRKDLFNVIQYFAKGKLTQPVEKDKKPDEMIFNQPTKLLIAEDNQMNLKLAHNVIQKILPKAQILEAKNGQEAVEQFDHKHPEIILMDIQMPVMGGIEATRIIRKRDKNIPIIALTAGVMKEEKEQCLDAGIDEFLGKPIRTDKMKKCLLGKIEQKEINTQPKSRTFDSSYLKSLLDDDPVQIKEILELFIESTVEQTSKLKNALKNKDRKATERYSHTIKGSALNIGANSFGSLANEIVQIARQGELKDAETKLDSFEKEQNELIKAIGKYLKKDL